MKINIIIVGILQNVELYISFHFIYLYSLGTLIVYLSGARQDRLGMHILLIYRMSI